MPRHYDRDDGPVGIALTAAAGFAAGLLAGMVAGEWLGNVNSARLKRLVRRWRRPVPVPPDPADVAAAVRDALRRNPATRGLDLTVHAPGSGLVELTGTAPTAVARQTAGDLARRTPGAEVVVNRILVEGNDLPPADRTG